MVRKIDVAIIGAGPAGVASAIYLKRAGFAPVVFEKDEPGGLVRNANLIENYPGFPEGITGHDFVARLKEQLDVNDVTVNKSHVRKIDLFKDGFSIETDSQNYFSQNVIIATGTRPKPFSLEGISIIMGKKAFHEIIRLPLEEKAGKKILILGGGDAAFDYAINLKKQGHEPIIISRSTPKCLLLLKTRVEKYGIKVLSKIDLELVDEKKDEIILRGKRNERRIEIRGDYLLIACGREPDLTVLSNRLRKSLSKKENSPKTKVSGLYLVGDVHRGRYRQTGIAVGDGILAAMLIEEKMIEPEIGT